MRSVSSVSSRSASILPPMPNRSSCGMLRLTGRHVRYNALACSITGNNRAGGGRLQRIVFTHTYENIISVENLFAAWKEFVRDKRKKKDVQEFQHRLMDYIRYSDDFVILSHDRNWLVSIIQQIADFLETKLALSLHPKKVSITTFSSGIDFLGWVHFPDHRVLRSATKTREEC